MQVLRTYLGWSFALISLICLRIALPPVFGAISGHHATLPMRNVMVTALFGAFGILFAIASWTVLRSKASAKRWGIAASLINIFVALIPTILSHRFIQPSLMVVLGIGLVGMFAFTSRMEKPVKMKENLLLPGDWTNPLVNKLAEYFMLGTSLVAYLWWIGWLKDKGAPTQTKTVERMAMTLFVLLIITTVHELGHAAAGIACGMKLRAFFIGPLQWRVNDGRWKFQFNIKGLFIGEGVTGIVPRSGKVPSRHYLTMMAGGPFVSLVIGMFAISLTFALPADSAAQAGGLLALFGAWSIALAIGNLLPFRTKGGYSDGAIILQLLSRGPMADYNLAVAEVGASLVSPLRPRDYDIAALQRAAQGISLGRQGMLVRLYAYSHSPSTAERRSKPQRHWLQQNLFATNLTPTFPPQCTQPSSSEMHTFAAMRLPRAGGGTACNPKKTVKFSADYWRAKSALHWIEGDLEKANEAWEKSNALAQRLPRAGAYEFSRDCGSLLRRSLDEAQLAA